MWMTTTRLARREKVTSQTIRRWIEGRRYQRFERTPGGHYRVWVPVETDTILDARVSSAVQHSSLATQKRFLRARDPDRRVVRDAGSGFDFKRRGFVALLERAMRGEAVHVVAATSECITRSGYPLIRHVIELSGGSIELLEEDDRPDPFDVRCLVASIVSFCNAHLGNGLLKGTRKIRAYPKNPELLHELVRQQRRVCNLAIARFIEVDRGLVEPKGPDLERTALRATIRDFVRSEVHERRGTFRSADCDEALDAAIRTRDAVIRRRKEGKGCCLFFSSIGDIRQRIAVRKLSGGFVAQNVDLAEPKPDDAWGKLTTIVLGRGQWFICTRMHIVTVGQDEIQIRSIVSLDPGVRTIVTAYSKNHGAMLSRTTSNSAHLTFGTRTRFGRENRPVPHLKIRDRLSGQTDLNLDADNQGHFQRGDND